MKRISQVECLIRERKIYNDNIKPLGKVQIIAGTLITMIGIYAGLHILGQFSCIISGFPCKSYTNYAAVKIAFAILTLFFLIIIIYRLIFNNNWLVKKLVPAEEPVVVEDRKKWLVCCLRIGMVLLGLILLAQLIHSIVSTARVIVGMPVWGRQLLSDFLYEKLSISMLFGKIFAVFQTALTIYLIIGAPHLVKYKTKQMFTNSKSEGL